MTKISTLANHLTLLRLAAIPVLLILLSFPQKLPSFLAALIFLLASLTDFLDGFFARRKKQVTTLGKLLDPLADKLLITAALIMLIPLKRVPAWMAFLIIAREIAVTGLRNILSGRGIVHYPYWGINFHLLGIVILWIALFLTLWSGLNYFIKYVNYLSE